MDAGHIRNYPLYYASQQKESERKIKGHITQKIML